MSIDMQHMATSGCAKKLNDISLHFIDPKFVIVTRHALKNIHNCYLLSSMQERAGDKIPDGFYALLSTADGNCFFNSISILLYGTEEQSKYLHLQAVIHT